MRPVLFSVLGIEVQTYGVSKALAAVVGAYLLGRAFERAGLKRETAHSVVLWATLWGFVGAKIYYLLEQGSSISLHDLGGAGFTWYGGLIGGSVASLVIIRRERLPLVRVADLMSIPLTLAYGIGRLGCFVSGDGTYGQPTDLPWGMAFPYGVVATDVPVHPTPLYEAITAVAIAGLLWLLRRRLRQGALFGAYLVLSGISRVLVELVRTNDPALFGLTQPQLWALLSIAGGFTLILLVQRRDARSTADRTPPGLKVPA